MTNSKPIDLHMRTYQERIAYLEQKRRDENATITTLRIENSQLNFDVKEAVESLATEVGNWKLECCKWQDINSDLEEKLQEAHKATEEAACETCLAVEELADARDKIFKFSSIQCVQPDNLLGDNAGVYCKVIVELAALIKDSNEVKQNSNLALGYIEDAIEIHDSGALPMTAYHLMHKTKEALK